MLEEDYVEGSLKDEYYSDITDDMETQWKADNGKTVKESLSDYLVKYMGKPMNQLLRYIRFIETSDKSHNVWCLALVSFLGSQFIIRFCSHLMPEYCCLGNGTKECCVQT